MTTTTNVLLGTGNGEIAFIDTSIAGYQTLLDGLREGVEALLIDGARDGLAQIAAALAGRSGIEAIHLFTHGAPGVLQLGATLLTEAGLADHAADLGVLRSALADGADLLLYGCDVGAGAVGESFLQALSAATGADVAASVDLSGSALLGGDWELEATTGGIEAHSALTPEARNAFAGVLAVEDENFDDETPVIVADVTEYSVGTWTFTSENLAMMGVVDAAFASQIVYGSPNDKAVVLFPNEGGAEAQSYKMKASDGAKFALDSIVLGQSYGSGTTLVVEAWSGVERISSNQINMSASSSNANFSYNSLSNDETGITGSLTFGSAYANITEVRFIFAARSDLQIDDIFASPAVTDTTSPNVLAVSVPANKIHAIGDELLFTVTFDENITVTGNSSKLSLDIGGAGRDATFKSSNANSITYSYTVQSGDLDADGITINALSLGTSTIRDAAGNPADLTLKNVGATAGVLVDGVAPAITGTITAPANGTYAAGSNLDFTVTFNENVTVTGTNSTLGLTIGSTTVFATHLSQTANSITYRYVVQAGNLDTDGIAVTGLQTNGSTIKDAAGNNANVNLTGHLPSLAGVRVDAVAPVVLGDITIPTADSYQAGEVLTFKVTFNENIVVTVGGAPSTLGLTIGSTARSASFVNSDANSVTYSYTVQAGDNDADGIGIGSIDLGGMTIRDAAGNNAVLSLAGHLPSTAAVLVDTSAPSVSGNVAVPANATYVAGQPLDFTVTFNENVTVSGSDSTLGLTVGSTARSAVFLSANGNSITYRYIVQAGDLDANGIDVGAIALGSSAVRDTAGNDANLSLFNHVPSTSGILVDGTVPAVSGAISVPGDGMYSVGQVLEFTVTFDENVNVTGTASTLGLDIGGAARSAIYDSKTANSITYIYIVQNGDNDADGIAVTGLALNGGTIRDAAGNNANLALSGHVPSLAGVLVDGGPPSVAGNIAVPAADSYRAGEVLRFTITFDENVTVSGADSTLGLDIGGVAHNAIYDSKTANSITYVYTVQAGDNDANGITVGAITLGATTIRDAAGNDAVLSLTGHLPSTAAILVDTTAPAVSGNVAVPANATYVAGQQLDFTVTFDENVTVSGSDSTLALTVGSTARSAVFLSANGN
ncbi:DUF4347 domain-containing protein, partial [Massilia oculi]|uniref:DUF4347 domain-containing protein n=1 Tax=Massilia oculi TaxID=945844 RepID=UPI0028A71AF9